MLAIISLITVTLVGLAIVAYLVLRLFTQARELEAQIARTRADLEPRYAQLRALTEREGAGSP